MNIAILLILFAVIFYAGIAILAKTNRFVFAIGFMILSRGILLKIYETVNPDWLQVIFDCIG